MLKNIVLLFVLLVLVVIVSFWFAGHANGLKAWRNVQLGTYQKKDDLTHEVWIAFRIRERGTLPENRYSEVLDTGGLTKHPISIQLVAVTLKELGLDTTLRRPSKTDPFGYEGPRVGDVYKRAKQLGLRPCPAEVGPQLFLQYGDQPVGEEIVIAVLPAKVEGSPGLLRYPTYRLRMEEAGQSLVGQVEYDGNLADQDSRYIFTR